MSNKTVNSNKCDCNSIGWRNKKNSKLTYLLSFVVAILPKCPFCFFGYSTVLTLCSGKNIHHYSPNNLNWMPIVLIGILIISMIWNFRGLLSYFALLFAFLGAMLVSYSEIYSGSEIHYYIGVAILFFWSTPQWATSIFF